MTEYVADITVGKNRWRWWADVSVRLQSERPDPGRYEPGAHDVHAWSEAAVREKANRLAYRRLQSKEVTPRRYEVRLPPKPTRPNNPEWRRA